MFFNPYLGKELYETIKIYENQQIYNGFYAFTYFSWDLCSMQ